MGMKQNEDAHDILFKIDNHIFSYRVAGILIREGRILLQNTTGDDGYAFPGGHVAFGETNAETLVREFKEEINADITVQELKWVAEIFFPWNDKPCHQICNYYLVELSDEGSIPVSDTFAAKESIDGRDFTVLFHWVPLSEVHSIKIYPAKAAELLYRLNEGVQHFIYREE